MIQCSCLGTLRPPTPRLSSLPSPHVFLAASHAGSRPTYDQSLCSMPPEQMMSLELTCVSANSRRGAACICSKGSTCHADTNARSHSAPLETSGCCLYYTPTYITTVAELFEICCDASPCNDSQESPFLGHNADLAVSLHLQRGHSWKTCNPLGSCRGLWIVKGFAIYNFFPNFQAAPLI
jgi:hypothetical protein